MEHVKRLLFGSSWFGRVLRILTLLTIFIYPFGWHYKICYIDGISMEPTYDDGQLALEQRLRSLGNDWIPERFDVITIWDKDGDIICKRVIGLPGETIEVKDGLIYIDNILLTDTFGEGRLTYQKYRDYSSNDVAWRIVYDNIPPTKIKLGEIWIIGDNREDSVFGSFPINEIEGKLVLY